ncbi:MULTISPECIES: hypothetical protein [Streptomyces]|uniref:hypothetical protein n=1 Tax=Streptomyces TaxID=1883 RepID=UPI00099E7B55|nr:MULTISPECIES: hypothetical protein [Streptomyces]MDI5906043.1 hypothetical protein [Streptomyces sp. 12257]
MTDTHATATPDPAATGHAHRPGQPALTHTEDNPANRTTPGAGGDGKPHHARREPEMTDTHATATPDPTATGHAHRPGQPALTHTEDNPANRTTPGAGAEAEPRHACIGLDMTEPHALTPEPEPQSDRCPTPAATAVPPRPTATSAASDTRAPLTPRRTRPTARPSARTATPIRPSTTPPTAIRRSLIPSPPPR